MQRSIRSWGLLAILAAGCGGSLAPKAFTPDDGAFEVLMRGKPKKTEQTQTTPAGSFTITNYTVDDADRRSYNVSLSDFPEAAIRGKDASILLDGGVRGMAKQWTVLASNPTIVQGHPGREVRVEAQPQGAGEVGKGRVRCFLVGKRLYTVLVIGPASKIKDEDMTQFLDSFKLLKDVPDIAVTGPPKAAPAPAPAPAVVAKPTQPSRPKPEPPKVAGDAPGSSPAGSSSGGASIVAFQWLDEKEDVVGGHGDASKPDGTRDQHSRLQLELPEHATLDSLTVTSGGFHKWVTKPTPGKWPIAVHRDGTALNKTHIETLGPMSGKVTLDLYFNTGIGLGPGSPYDLTVVVVIDGKPQTLTAHCERPKG